MAVSEDLRSVQAVLSELVTENKALIGLLCDNLESLAEQVEALEELPFSPATLDVSVFSYDSGGFAGYPACLLQ